MSYIKITYRNIAKMLSSKLPVEGEDFGDKVNDYLGSIKALPKKSKIALKSAYIFSRKVPREEREDMFQELFSAIYAVNTEDERFAYAIARRDWQDWWQKYKTRKHFMAGSLNDTVLDSDNQEVELAELIVGETEFELKMDGHLDAERIWNKLPDIIKPLVQKRLLGKPLTNKERARMSYYVKTQGYKLLLN